MSTQSAEFDDNGERKFLMGKEYVWYEPLGSRVLSTYIVWIAGSLCGIQREAKNKVNKL